jgi:cytochrome c peroxidase
MLERRLRWAGAAAAALLLVGLAGCDSLCETPGCLFTRAEWDNIQELAELPEQPPLDPSNKYDGNAAAQALGQKFYFDARFSGGATLVDTLMRPVPYARAAPAGTAINISCATCHNPARAGTDVTSNPGYVSVGAGWYDVNSQPTVNAAYYDAIYWNGRNDSLWAQIIAVNESFVSMNSTRLNDFWVIMDKYAAEYGAVFGAEYPLPTGAGTTKTVVEAAVDATGKCSLDVGGGCTNPSCRLASDGSCWPRFPLRGKPGSKAGCQSNDATEPFSDAYDCMDANDKATVTRVYVNFAKAIAAYESLLISRNSAFDQWAKAGPDSNKISDAAKRGARLFVGKAACYECHNSGLLSDGEFHNVGVPQVGAAVPTVADCVAGSVCDCVAGNNCLPWGAWDGLKKLNANGFKRTSAFSDSPTDTSHQKLYDLAALVAAKDPSVEELKGQWRTPGLRDVSLTGPYMHDGLYRTLEDVIWHYNEGGAPSGYAGTKAVQLKPLGLTEQDVSDLVAFLGTLNGTPLPESLVTSPVLP